MSRWVKDGWRGSFFFFFFFEDFRTFFSYVWRERDQKKKNIDKLYMKITVIYCTFTNSISFKFVGDPAGGGKGGGLGAEEVSA